MKLIVIVSAILLLTLPAWAGTFLVDFNNGNLDEWQEFLMPGVKLGSWEIIDSELHAVSNGQSTRLLAIGDEAWSDYTFEFDVKPLKQQGRSNIAIAARINGDWVVWCMIGDLPPFPDNISRALCVAGNFRALKTLYSFGSEHHLPMNLKQWSKLKLEVEGNTLNLWINEKKVIGPIRLPNRETFQQLDAAEKRHQVEHHGADPENFEAMQFGEFQDFLTGSVGLGLSNQTARFDNLIITGDNIPNSDGLSVTPQSKLPTFWGNLKRP